jgi:potassium-transporting ATPase potassium-binding subunit
MTINGWIQIAIFAALVVAVVVPLGGYMARVFAGERTPLMPILMSIEGISYLST